MRQDPTDPTGVHDDSERGNKGVTNARNRKANAALKLHMDGVHMDDIAETLGYPDGGAVRVAIELALQRELREDSREEMRRMVGYRLQRLTGAVWRKAINEESPEQMAAQREARANLAEFARVYGLSAPTEHIVHTPTATELENWVMQVVAQSVPQLEEADIFDADVVEPDMPAITGSQSAPEPEPIPAPEPHVTGTPEPERTVHDYADDF